MLGGSLILSLGVEKVCMGVANICDKLWKMNISDKMDNGRGDSTSQGIKWCQVWKQQITWYGWEIKFVLRKLKRDGKGTGLGLIKKCIKYQAKKYWRFEEELYGQICVSKLMNADCNE